MLVCQWYSAEVIACQLAMSLVGPPSALVSPLTGCGGAWWQSAMRLVYLQRPPATGTEYLPRSRGSWLDDQGCTPASRRLGQPERPCRLQPWLLAVGETEDSNLTCPGAAGDRDPGTSADLQPQDYCGAATGVPLPQGHEEAPSCSAAVCQSL